MVGNVLDYLKNSALRCPDKIVFSDGELDSVSFSKLNMQVITAGSWILSELQGTKGSPIAVIAERNCNTLAAFLSVVYSGNFYIPIDCQVPLERMEMMLENVKPSLVINCGEALLETEYKTVSFKDMLSFSEVLPQAKIKEDDILYGIFTSGSTGVPKLVVKSHRSLISFIEIYTDLFNYSETDVIGNQIPFYFDASTKDIFSTLKMGATMYIIPKEFFAQPGKLAQYLLDKKISSLVWVPSALYMFSRFKVFDKIKFPEIKRVFFVGEPMQIKQLNVWLENLPEADFVNLYGSTENAGNTLYYRINEKHDESGRLPIGKPFPTIKAVLLDENDREIPKDSEKIGEICVSGDFLASGYYNNEKETAEKFIKAPTGERMYHSGDMARYDKNGNLVFVSRKDFQIKHSGYRIELGDIEVAADSIAFINSSCCVYDHDRQKIILFYSADEKDDKAVGNALRERLPSYMVPSKYIYLEEMPLNANGKINRTELMTLCR